MGLPVHYAPSLLGGFKGFTQEALPPSPEAGVFDLAQPLSDRLAAVTPVAATVGMRPARDCS